MNHYPKDPMEYLPDMEQLDSSLLQQVWEADRRYGNLLFRVPPLDANIESVLSRDNLGIEDFAVLLSPGAGGYLEEMAQRASAQTARHFGNAITLFTPLYLSNYCENHCIYCGFHCKNAIRRGKLNEEELHRELEAIAATGLQEILLLTGECRSASPPDYIGRSVEIASGYFSTIGIEVYPLESREYVQLRHCGADYVSVYQETYDIGRYGAVHQSGPKRCYPYRFHAQERALQAGMRGVAFGSLLGLGDFRRDAFAAGVHGFLTQKKYPHAEISFSFPRLRPHTHQIRNQAGLGIGERELLQVMLAYRIFLPFSGITLSTRERPWFRDHVAGLAATKLSAGVRVGIGGHEIEEKGEQQFEIADTRSVAEIRDMLLNRNLQPVFSDYIRV